MSDLTKTTSTTAKFDSQESGGNERHSLQTYVSDLLALVTHIEVPIDKQSTTQNASEYGEALAIIAQIKSVMAAQHTALDAQLAALGGHGASGIKSAWSGFLGAGAAAINSVRKTKISKSLRDDYTALNLAAISYTMLHATALGLGETSVASMAQKHLAQITPIIMRINRAIPAVVLEELRDDGENVRVSAAEMSAQTTQAAWQ